MGWYQRRVHGGSSSHCLSLVAALEILRPYKTNKMNPLFVISALFASAIAAPTATLLNAAPLTHAGFAAPLAHAGYAAPLLHAAPIAAPAAISLPAPHVTQAKEADITTIHKPAPVITKQVHLGQTTYVSGHTTQILKPAIPDFKIAVPTALKGTQTVNAPIVKVQKEIHTIDQPIPVEKPYNVPYDVIKHVERIVEVPTPVHVAKPVPYDVPTPVQGHPIVRKVQGAPIVRHHHTNVVAQPALHHAPIAYAGHHAGFAPLPVAHHA